MAAFSILESSYLRQGSLPSPSATSPPSSRPRANTTSFSTTALAPSVFINTFSGPCHHLFHFGAEFESILRPKANVFPGVSIPGLNASVRQLRDFNLELLQVIASLLSSSGLPCDAYDQNEDNDPDYKRWNATLDGSLSKKHIGDGFCKSRATIYVASPPINTLSPLITLLAHSTLSSTIASLLLTHTIVSLLGRLQRADS